MIVCTALEKQKESLEKLAEGRLQWRLREKERELKQELSYQVDWENVWIMNLSVLLCVCRPIRFIVSTRVN